MVTMIKVNMVKVTMVEVTMVEATKIRVIGIWPPLCHRDGLNPSSLVTGIFLHEPS